MKKILVIPLLVLSFLVSNLNVSAQEDVSIPEGDLIPDWQMPQAIENGASCFDYYKFQSVNVSMNTENQAYQAGETIKFSGFITNSNTYPIVDGNVYVRISRYNENYFTEGHNIVDEFFAVENLSLREQEKKEFTFTWDAPQESAKGKYVVDYFFSVGKKFNLGGLAFSNEIVAGSTQFDINSGNGGMLSFKKDSVQFNGAPYRHIGSWPEVEKGSEAKFSYTLSNESSKEVESSVSYTAYYWDNLEEKNQLISKSESVKILPGETKELSFAIPNVTESVYYVQAIAKHNSSKSIVNTRFSVINGEKPRLNYPAITKFPLKKGDNFTLFSCFHNTTLANAKGVIEVTISDKNNKIIATAKHEGDIPSAMSAIKKDVVAEKDYDQINLQAKVTDLNGKLLDEYKTTYSCEQFGICEKENKKESFLAGVGSLKSADMIKYILMGIFALIVIIVLFKVTMGKKGIRCLLLIFGLSAGFLGMHNDVNAASVSSAKNYNHGHYRTANGMNSIFDTTFASGTVSLNHNVDGATFIGCGGYVDYSYAPNLAYNATGGAWDTPYGHLCSDYTSASCFESNITKFGQSVTSVNNNRGYIHWTASYPGVTLSSSDTNIVTCSGMRCSAVAGKSGSAIITASFSGATARIWSAAEMRMDNNSTNRSKIDNGITNGFWGTPSRWSCPSGVQCYLWVSPSDHQWSIANGLPVAGYASKMSINGAAWQPGNTMVLEPTSTSWWVTVGGGTATACTPSMTSLSHTCNAAGTQATLSWSGQNATAYALRYNYGGDDWACPAAYPWDVCQDVVGTSRVVNVTPGVANGWWVHAYNGVYSDALGETFTCNPPAPVVSLAASLNPVTNLNNNSTTVGTKSTTLTWTISDITSCGTKCTCTLNGPDGSITKDYNSSDISSRTYSPQIRAGNNNFNVICTSSYGANSNNPSVTVTGTCNEFSYNTSCNKECGDEDWYGKKITTTCSDVTVSGPNSCGHPACPVSSEWKETKPLN